MTGQLSKKDEADLVALQQRYQKEVDAASKIRRNYEKLVGLSSQLETQLHENTMVKEELELVKEGGTVFKLTGPVLIPQQLSEAKTVVDRRISYITDELKRNGELINKAREELGAGRTKVTTMEQELHKFINSRIPKP